MVEGVRDVSTIDMPIDEHAEDQRSNVGTSQVALAFNDSKVSKVLKSVLFRHSCMALPFFAIC